MAKKQARARLAEHLKQTGVTQAAFGASIRAEQTAVSNWVLGKSRPDWLQRFGIALVAGICPLDWLTPAERRAFEVIGANVTIKVEKVAA